MLIVVLAAMASAQKPESITLRGGQQKRAAKSHLTIKFISVVEDSRPPEGSMAVWAGNAKIEVRISDRRGSKTVFINTNTGVHGDQYGGYAINLVDLTEKPRSGDKPALSSYRATFSIERLYR